MKTEILTLSLTLALAACGGGGGDGGDRASASDVQEFRTTATAVSSAATGLAANAGAMPDAATCRSDEAAYEPSVRAMLERMRAMSGAMDRQMAADGHMGSTDLACATAAMMAELDRHAAAACRSSDMAANRAEIAQHAEVMVAWADHQRARCDELDSMMGGGTMMGGAGMGGTIGACQQNPDGTYTLGGMPADGMMP